MQPSPRGHPFFCCPGLPRSATLSCSALSGDSFERGSDERRGGKVAPGCHAAVLLRLLLPLMLQWRAAAWREYKRCAGRELRSAGEEGVVQGWASSWCDAEAPLRCGSREGGAVLLEKSVCSPGKEKGASAELVTGCDCALRTWPPFGPGPRKHKEIVDHWKPMLREQSFWSVSGPGAGQF